MINGIVVTDVIIFPVKSKVGSKLKAFARVVLNDQLIIHGLRIFEGMNGSFLTYPADTSGKEPVAMCNPITAELRAYISDKVLTEYEVII